MDWNGDMFIMECGAAERPAVSCSDWLDDLRGYGTYQRKSPAKQIPANSEATTKTTLRKIGKAKRRIGWDDDNRARLNDPRKTPPNAIKRTGNKNGRRNPGILRGGWREITKDKAVIKMMQIGKPSATR